VPLWGRNLGLGQKRVPRLLSDLTFITHFAETGVDMRRTMDGEGDS
jgi:hypothetical protein